MIVGLLGYGVYLNERSENQITLRMNERSLPLHGVKVATRNIYPVFKLDFINFYSNEMVDVTALILNKIILCVQEIRLLSFSMKKFPCK